ncbi:PspA/IM30 family protein [Microcoleus sp. FACHB-831]|uniref:PspA/IM30 family protein n=1 Tax=Microcoleus sp. FACHB-831 TaxID=2692827 RepID=UPI001689C211|nr:PspA/IM30 family protein [Microcoleus sp. FACHB-831]MBD1923122.1 PspA/IM30 family protein [Microcoleus sp. FACHB-831]
MGFTNRILRVIRAKLNKMIGRSEDPEKILEKAVAQMQENLIQLRQAVANAIATKKRTQRQLDGAKAKGDECYARSQLNWQKGDEKLAREALIKRRAYQGIAVAMEAHLATQKTVIEQLKKDMRKLEAKISELKTQKDLYIARVREAETSAIIKEMLDIDTSTSLDAFKKIEEKLLELEAQTEAIAELEIDELAEKFVSPEATKQIDDELTAIKAQLINRENLPPHLPTTDTQTVGLTSSEPIAAIDPSLEVDRSKLPSQLNGS